jgi:1-acyl-sn-glycerol-3-phosphate acyltransferase
MNTFYRLVWLGYRTWFTVYHRYRVCNAERVPLTGPVLLACNHASFYDPPLVGSALPRDICYLARESLFKTRLGNWALRRVNCIPVDREGGGAAGLKGVLDHLARGRAVILFPEGTRTRDGNLQSVRSGIGLAVLKAEAPLVPVRVFGTYAAWGRHRRFPLPATIVVKFGQPLRFEALRAEAKTCSKARLKGIYQEVADAIIAAIAALQPCVDKDTFP